MTKKKSFWLYTCERLINLPQNIYVRLLKRELGCREKGANIETPVLVCNYPKNIFLYEGANIRGHSMFLNTPSTRFVMGKKSRAGQGLTVITNNHQSPPSIGVFYADSTKIDKHNVEKDVIVEEDVWIGANVTLLAGVIVGRGAIVGSNAVCTKYIPPYAIVVGNPARVIKFKFSTEEIIEHEKLIYPDSERLPLSLLEQNYIKYSS
jgi:acetyltransferase-like isoleucine patch superfamily enzyme